MPKELGYPPTRLEMKPNASREWYSAGAGTRRLRVCGPRPAPGGRGGGSVCLERRKIRGLKRRGDTGGRSVHPLRNSSFPHSLVVGI